VWVIGEDAGIEVEALGWGPGPRSARWSDRPLEEVLTTGAGGRARYRCTIVGIAPDGREVVADGTLEGSVADRARGDEGFGYDPIFVPDGEDRTSAELAPEEKDALSHRGRALRALLPHLRGLAGGGSG
jgi:XTP/dITP diphosphohydrolase